MQQAMEYLDISMKNLTLELIKYQEDDPKYKSILAILAKQYETFNYAYDLLSVIDAFGNSFTDGVNKNHNTYFIKYADMEQIKALLMNNGYLKQPGKTVSVKK